MEEFADKLRELREKANLTQEALARKANLSLGYVAKLEQGKANPSWTTVRALAKALGKTPNDFLRDAPFASEPEAPKKTPAKKSKKSDGR
jgi:transcriptional regulator with XRE-family HTH domain